MSPPEGGSSEPARETLFAEIDAELKRRLERIAFELRSSQREVVEALLAEATADPDQGLERVARLLGRRARS